MNEDGVVDFLDIGPFVAILSDGSFQCEAGIDESGVVTSSTLGRLLPFLAVHSAWVMLKQCWVFYGGCGPRFLFVCLSSGRVRLS